MFIVEFDRVYIDLDGLKSCSNLSVKLANLSRGRIYNICANSLLYSNVLGMLTKSWLEGLALYRAFRYERLVGWMSFIYLVISNTSILLNEVLDFLMLSEGIDKQQWAVMG